MSEFATTQTKDPEMLEHYRSNIDQLHEEEVALVVERLASCGLIPSSPRPSSPDTLYHTCSVHQLAHVDLIVPLLPVPGLLARNCIEKLLGRAITRVDPEDRERFREHIVHQVQHARTPDQRIITDIVPNPKRPGSGAHERYQLYREGMTVGEYFSLGGTRADVNYDSKRGYITVRPPRESRT